MDTYFISKLVRFIIISKLNNNISYLFEPLQIPNRRKKKKSHSCTYLRQK